MPPPKRPVLPFLVVLTASLKCSALGDEMSPRTPDFIPDRFYWQNYLIGVFNFIGDGLRDAADPYQ